MTTPAAAAKTAKPTPAARRRASASIHRRRIIERDGARREFQVTLEADETYDEASEPAFLGLKADVFRPGDVVRFVGHQLAFVAERLIVRADEALSAVWTVELWRRDLEDAIAGLSQFDYGRCRIEHTGNGVRIVHGHAVVQDGFLDEAAAEKWLARRAKAVDRD